MAGGVGSRFWPMSTADNPKQFIDVLGVGKTLLQLTVDRFETIIPKENVWVVTNQKYMDIVSQQLPEMPRNHILCEPCRRNTAPCIAYVSWRIKSNDPKANIVVSPSDHVVMNVNEFRRIISECMEFTYDSDAIVTLGMKPTRPETGYGRNPTWKQPSNISVKIIISGMPAFSFGMFLPLSMLSESISLLWLRFSSLYFQSTVPTKNRLRLIVCSLNVIIFLLTMPLWRKPRKSLYVLQISDGVIWALGALFFKTQNKTFMAMHALVPTSP